MKDIIINSIKEYNVSVEALYDLRKAAFVQWAEKGLDTTEADVPLAQFNKYLSNKEVFVTRDMATGELLAMHVLMMDEKKGCATGSNLAVIPHAKNQGIASCMLQEEVAKLRHRGYRYLKGSTAISATWSVRWHLKNGYHIIGYTLNERDNYASYLFRKQFAFDFRHHPSDLLWTQPLAPLTAHLCFLTSYLATHLCKDSQGCLNKLGHLIKRMMS